MIILAEKLAGQNSAYRHRKYEGRFRKRRRPSLLQWDLWPALLPATRISGHRRFKFRFFLQQRQNFFHQRVSSDPVFLAQ